jgi:hypothetical protein
VLIMSGGRTVPELRARDGRAVLARWGDAQPCENSLPEDLAPALHEWAGVVEAVRRAGESHGPAGEQVSERGRILAARLARSIGAPVRYADPISGVHEVMAPTVDGEPAPWATGLPVSAATAVLVGVALLALSRGLASVGVWMVVLGNVVVAFGLAPSMWLGRATPVWRWVVYGAVAGILLTWTALLLTHLR